MHSVCAHTKVLKDMALAAHSPPLKRLLDTFVFKAKVGVRDRAFISQPRQVILANNNCASAFWMGALKHKDLHGLTSNS
jgi:hypothetical protein